MRKLFTLLMALVATLSLFAGNTITYTATAQPTEETYSTSSGLHTNAFYNGSTQLSITSHTFSDGTGTITFSGELTKIGDNAFRGCTGLTSITIPESVTGIGYSAFEGCTGLTSVTIPNSVTSMGYSAFSSVNNIVYSGSATGSPWGAKSVNGYVEGYLVYADASKTSLLGCSSAATGNITIPNSVTSIGSYAFRDCTGLTSVTIPNSVTKIGSSAFFGCTGLTSVHITDLAAWCNLSFSNLGTNPLHYAHHLFMNGTEVTDLVIPNSVTKIGSSAFSGCTGLTSVTIPNSVTSIGGSVFDGCTGMTSVTIGSGVTSIGSYAFSGCTGLTSVTIPNSVTSIVDNAFDGCTGLTSVTIPNSVTEIGSYVFRDCTGLTSVTIPNSVTKIGWRAFSGCTGLTSVTIGSGVTSIDDYAFCDCTGLTSVMVEASIPPTISYSSSFDGVTATIIIPCGTYAAYSAAQYWSSMNLTEGAGPAITAVVTNEIYGSVVVPDTDICKGETATISANPNYGYHFTQWNDGNTDNPRSFVLTQDTAFTAEFAKNTYTLTTVAGANGSVSAEGTALYQDTVTVSATANYGYCFTQWNDGNTDNPRIVVITKDSTLTAYFAPRNFTASILPQDPQMMDTSSVTMPYMEATAIEAYPHYGYHFVQWTDGVTDNPRMVTLTSDSVFVAVCALNDYTISTNVPLGHGTITGAGTYPYNSTVTLTAVPDKGYKLKMWSDGSTENPHRIQVDGDMLIEAEFEVDYYTITVQTNDFSMGVAYGSGMQISGNEAICTASANPGYHFVMWDNNEARNPYGCTVTSDTTIMAIFAADQQAGGNVSVLPSDSTAAVAWPTVSGAKTYTLVIWKDNTKTERVCTLTFSSTGKLISINFSQGSGAAPRRAPAQTAVGGLNFTVTGLQTASPYKLALLSKDEQEEIVDIKECTFHTNGYSALEDVDATSSVEKFIRNGQLYIRRNGQLFDATGRLVE